LRLDEEGSLSKILPRLAAYGEMFTEDELLWEEEEEAACEEDTLLLEPVEEEEKET
jgi:hypothetical protein